MVRSGPLATASRARSAVLCALIATSLGGCAVFDQLEDCETDRDCIFGERCNAKGNFCEQSPTISIGTFVLDPADVELAGEWRDAMDLAVETINEAGGVRGREAELRVELVPFAVIANPAADAAENYYRERTRALLDAGVLGVVGTATSDTTLAVQEITYAEKVLTISAAATTPQLTTAQPATDRYFFRTEPTVGLGEGAAAATFITEQTSCTQVSFARISSAFFDGYYDAVSILLASRGVCVTRDMRLPDASQPDYPQATSAIAAADPECLVVLAGIEASATLVRGLASESAEPPQLFGTSTWGEPAFLEATRLDPPNMVPNAAEGAYISTSSVDDTRRASREFRVLYNQTFGYELDRELPPNLAGYYDAVLLVALAAERGGDVSDRTAIRDGLWDVSRRGADESAFIATQVSQAFDALRSGLEIKYVGASGDLDFDEFGDVAGYSRVSRVNGGSLETVANYGPADAAEINAGAPGSCPPAEVLRVDGADW